MKFKLFVDELKLIIALKYRPANVVLRTLGHRLKMSGWCGGALTDSPDR